MSQTYIPGIVSNIRGDSTPYTPVIEAITNSIDAITKTGAQGGRIDITLTRENTLPGTEDVLPLITSIAIRDNGVGFTNENRDSFDTLYSPHKKDIGGKGFGRFFYLKYFTDIAVKSVFVEEGTYKERTFNFGKQYEAVVDEFVVDSIESTTFTEVYLKTVILGKYDKDPQIFAHRILEQLLNFFVDASYACPEIVIHDSELSKPLVLNSLIGDSSNSLIQLRKSDVFKVNGIDLQYKMFKILHPRNQKSKIILTAHNQAVTEKSLDIYVPDFSSDFVEDVKIDGQMQKRNYITRFYVQGNYLDENVTTERDGYNFGTKPDSLYPVDSTTIEAEVAKIAKTIFGNEVGLRSAEKKKKFKQYADKNIWYRAYIEDLDLDKIKPNPSEIEMETALHKVKYERDISTKQKISQISKENRNFAEAHENATQLIKEVKEASISDLAQYIAFRKSILELFKTTLSWSETSTYETEKAVHDIIFPTKTDSDETGYEGHNLWIIDEGLNLTQYLSSDKNIFNENKDRPDIAAFHYNVAYRESSESHNPVSVFEFKRPGRNDFVNPSSNEDPVSQIVRYVNSIRNGDYKTPEGHRIHVSETTPFYGYVIADVDKKVEKWLIDEKNFKQMPDNQGWFYIQDNINLHVEVVTWEKLLKDAEVRHRIFFEKLGLEG